MYPRLHPLVGLPSAVSPHQFELQVVQRINVGKTVADRALQRGIAGQPLLFAGDQRQRVGGTVGAIAAAIAAVGTTIALPGLGLVIAGPLAAAIAGAATGGIVGALVGWNIPEERVKKYDEGIRKGGILIGVRPRSDEDAAYFENAWKTHRADDIYR